MITLNGYYITEILYQGTRTEVYRGTRNSDNQPVIIKVLRNQSPKFNELVQFHNQYVLTRHLEHPTIVQPLALERYGNGYALVMPDDGAIALPDYWYRGVKMLESESEQSLSEFLKIAIQLAESLHYLNQKRIIHKDIKPANILINTETKQVQLIDFSIASLLPKEQQELTNPNVLEGTLAYISPEQTGRMNRGIDYRSDFYSLGVTFFELLIGELPFTTDDAMELVHCHIAKMPILGSREQWCDPTSATDAGGQIQLRSKMQGDGEEKKEVCVPPIPQMVIEIVMKLMAKNAEERYQSALGLKYDLQKCLEQWESTGEISQFALGERDLSDRFLMPEKLYGREKEVAILLAAFERIGNGRSEMMLVAGFSGIGKTAIVNEVHKPITRQQGYFIKGKFDQFNRNLPFSAFVQAFRDLMGQLLSESDAQLERWGTKILAAVGENGQVIVEVIPELEQIIGQQPPVSQLSGSAAQNRFNLLFPKFIQVFTTKKHPLVMFLDDLQWADSASLNLLQLLMSKVSSKYLLILGAYRDNEVFPAHPLMLTLEQIHKAGAVVNTITLEPLGEMTVNHLVADTLSCREQLAQPLTRLVYQKTQGNPFFTTQFLKALYEDGWIEFQTQIGYWQCNMAVVQQLALTDDVVEFMALQLQKLSLEIQEVLKLAACIGNKFDLGTLAIVSEQSLADIAPALWKALQEGLILPQGQVYKLYIEQITPMADGICQTATYKFLHDRVQQAAYSLIPEDQKQITHLQIGQLLLHNTSKTEREERIFEIVNQLNMGMDLIAEPEQRSELAQLNLIAGRKAKVANAYAASFEYFRVGIKLLASDSWVHSYHLTLALYESAAEAAYLSNNFEEMEQLIEVVLQQTPTLLDRIKVYDVKIQGYGTQNKFMRAVSNALTVLKDLGFPLPESPIQSDIQQALEKTKTLLTDKGPSELMALPEMEMPESQAAMQILSSIIPIAYQISPPLFVLSVLKQVDLSVQYGNTDLSTYAYACYGCILCSMTGEIEEGFDFGQLSLTLLEKFPAKELKAKSFYAVSAIITHWQEYIGSTLKSLLDCYTYALESGDLFHTAWAIYMYGYHSYFIGRELSELEQEMASHSEQLGQIRQESVKQVNNICRQAALNLMGMSDRPVELRGSAYDDQIMLPQAQEDNNHTVICKYYIQKLILSYLFGDELAAMEATKLVEPYLSAVVGYVDVPLYHFYDSLVRLSVFLKIDESEQEGILERVIVNQEKMEEWAAHARSNYLHKFELVEAERHQILGNKAEALEYYDRAIAKAQENNYIQEEALANELAGKFYLNWGKEKVAAGYIQEAYYCYARWGAKAKVKQLEQTYPQLLSPILQQVESSSFNTTTIHNISQRNLLTVSTTTSLLDFTSAIKASQAISEEIELDALLSKLMQIIIENAGADTSALILNNSGTWEIAAFCEGDNCRLLNIPLDQTKILPKSMINKVKRTRQKVLINHFNNSNINLSDPYFIKQTPKSLYCTPMLNQGKLIGILYLENHLSTGAFTPDRIEVLNLLSAKAAISIQNALLYRRLEDYSHNLEAQVEIRTQELQENNQQLQQTLEQLQSTVQQLQHTQAQLIQTEKMSSLGQMVAGITHEINNPITFIAGNITHAQEYFQDLVDLIDLYTENFPQSNPAIQEKLAEIDLEFLYEDLKHLFSSMQNGSDRISKIILGLRNFSRLDESESKEVDIHEGLDNTLMIVQHRFQAKGNCREISIVKNYGKLPLVHCYPSQLNQVFWQIITNAIDALRTPESSANPEIRIISETQNDKTVRISIADNGPGMSEQVRQKIFDPFFTTKPVGEGTGLGLSTSYQIITKQHHGKLYCISQLGKSTEFAIEIPVLLD
ncbi:trifunctional serine/threonine-protein kinase/ATP-binding protein/sensor histidine kinase [Dapis sp. BLCC M126]|uniref:trifunctional serine/threonine-protein kinase/ATP-binding protein/sensor histidine kinase n=1 Tax=Dapis sp. BLCC M126 TaxID=3400189 RepID=UPI003CF2F390